MRETQKEKNQKYILDNLGKYILDSRGNFVHIDSDLMGSENAELYFVGKEAVSNHEEILEAIEKMILQNKEDWKADRDYTGFFVENRKDGRVIYEKGFGSLVGFSRGYRIIGELGYRECVWKDYEKNKKREEDYLKLKEENEGTEKWLEEKRKEWEEKLQNPTSSSTPTRTNNQVSNTPKNSSEDEKESNNSNNQNKGDNNTSLPPPADIQTHYKTDRAQTEITDNPNLTDTQAKQQAQELLKLIITAELLIKEAKTNSEILTKLLKEKNQNSSVYQLLNKDKRIDQAITKLESIEKENKPRVNNQNKNSLIPPFILFGLLLALFLTGIILLKKKSKPKKISH